MKNSTLSHFSTALVISLALFATTSCNNILSSFPSGDSDVDQIEKAQHCLTDNDYTCAITEYGKIKDPTLKAEKLCLANMGKAGFTLPALVDVVKAGGATMLGGLTNRLIPWTQAKQDAALESTVQCTNFVTLAGTGSRLAVLLDALSRFTFCTILVGKTDQFIGTSNADTTCNTAGNNDGIVHQAEISDSTGAPPGMCITDVTSCRDAILGINSSALQTLGFTDIKAAFDAIPNALKTSGPVTDTTRKAIHDVFQN